MSAPVRLSPAQRNVLRAVIDGKVVRRPIGETPIPRGYQATLATLFRKGMVDENDGATAAGRAYFGNPQQGAVVPHLLNVLGALALAAVLVCGALLDGPDEPQAAQDAADDVVAAAMEARP